MSNFLEIHPVGTAPKNVAELTVGQATGRTDITKATGAFRYSAKASKQTEPNRPSINRFMSYGNRQN